MYPRRARRLSHPVRRRRRTDTDVDRDTVDVAATDLLTRFDRDGRDTDLRRVAPVVDEPRVGGEHVVAVDAGGLIHETPLTEETLYASRRGTVVALATSDGSERWTTSVDAEFALPRAVTDDVLVVEDDRKGTLYAFDAEAGERRWTLDVSDERLRGPVVGDGAVFAATENGRVVVRDV